MITGQGKTTVARTINAPSECVPGTVNYFGVVKVTHCCTTDICNRSKSLHGNGNNNCIKWIFSLVSFLVVAVIGF